MQIIRKSPFLLAYLCPRALGRQVIVLGGLGVEVVYILRLSKSRCSLVHMK